MSVGLGAFAQGLAGGMSLGKSFKDGKKKDAPAAAAPGDQKSVGFGIGQNLVGGDVGSAEIAGSAPADSSSGSWSALANILGGIINSNTGA